MRSGDNCNWVGASGAVEESSCRPASDRTFALSLPPLRSPALVDPSGKVGKKVRVRARPAWAIKGPISKELANGDPGEWGGEAAHTMLPDGAHLSLHHLTRHSITAESAW